MGIRSKLILSTCIPLLIIYVIVLGWDYWASRQVALEQIEMLVAQRAAADAGQLDGRIMAIQATAGRAVYIMANRVVDPNHPTTPTTREANAGARDRQTPPDFLGPPGGFGNVGGPGGPGGRPPPDGEFVRPPSTEPFTPGDPNRVRPRGSGGANGGRGGYIRGGGGGGGGADGVFFGRGALADQINQSPWISAIWYQFAPGTMRQGTIPEAAGLRRLATENPPFERFTPVNGKEAAWFTRPLKEGRSIWLEPDQFQDAEIGPACVFAAPFYATGESTPAGVVCVSVPVAALRLLREDTPVQLQLRQILSGNTATTRPTTNVALEPPSLAAGGYLLLDHKGQILSRPDGREQGTTLAVGPDDDELREAIERAMKGRGAIVVAGGLNSALGESAPNARYVLAMEQLPSTGWLFVTAQSEAYLLGPVQSRLIKRGIFLAGSLGVLVGVMTLVLTRFCRPIEKMAARVHEMARGQLDIAPVPVLANDELGELANGFNEMTGRLRHHVRELTEQSAEREKVDSELRIARQIQSDLLPREFPPFPDRHDFALHAVNLPARHIAGDFFDYFFAREDRLTVVIADVSGKGVPAALMMAVVRTMVRNLAETGQSPRQIAERVNRMLVEETTPGLFVTMILGQYEPATGQFVYVNAGHPPAILVSNGQASTCCEPTGPLLGVAIDDLGPFEQGVIMLAVGDTVLLYTDGVTEAHDETNVMFGQARLLKVTSDLAGRTPPDLCEGVVEAVMAHQHQSAGDDVTLVSLRRTADNIQA